ncbi:hypothetical protein JTE90_006885 [Oedothorax gibbosus]|uniref:RRM domain-containing protein n=1 Tax=Oedothorax gibbosus TaxID=931172 RepID=A0AAV6VMU3_9ARAC|nr:hypothetical protein JTE90_006885 [Oedothorax gibbosus]
MPKYQVGDVASLFPKPAKPKTESGKKIQSLFEDFYKKPSKKLKSQNKVETKEKQAEEVTHQETNETVKQKKPKKEKRKFQSTNEADSAENTTAGQVSKKQKLEPATANAPFPRSKKEKNPKNLSYLTKSKFPDPNMDDEELFPRKKGKHVTFDQDDDDISTPQKKKKGKTTSPTKEPENTSLGEEKSEAEIEERKRKRAEKKKARKLAKAQENQVPDFLKLPPVDMNENSKAVFRMKKKRVIPSCKEVFENNDQNESVVEDGSPQKLPSQNERSAAELEERLSRTLFVGNLPLNTNKKDLVKLFSPFGSLETCRLRGAIPQKSSIPRKIAEIKGKYHASLHSRIAYVVLKERKSAIEALSLSGTQLDGHHIVVDRAAGLGEKKVYDEKRSIFVGNLPFHIKDDTLWNTFLPCGSIEFVRVIRDKETGAGKGFGYVCFQKIQGKENALALTDLEIEGRTLRIQSATGGQKQKGPQTSSPWKGIGKKIAKKQKMKSANTNSRKTLKKLMHRGKQQHQKKKIAGIFKKFSKN